MIDRLRIKCPSCGLFLDVTNSKHEAVKTITCPGCKKRLSIDFKDKPAPKPIIPFYYGEMPIALQEGLNQVPIPDCAHLEINVVRISDGGTKCIVRPLSANHPVIINGTQLELEDKAVLDFGDRLKIGNTILTYGKGEKTEGILLGSNKVSGSTSTPDTKPQGKPRSYKRIIIGFVAIVIAAGLVILFWPKRGVLLGQVGGNSERVDTPIVEQHIQERVDTPAVGQTVPEPDGNPAVEETVSEPRIVIPPTPHSPRDNQGTGRASHTPQPLRPSYSDMSDYELEFQAKNDVKAQYEWGKRLISRRDSTHLVLGINYLKMAIRNGSNDAQRLLQNTYNSLEQKAAKGNRVAENILREQR